MQKIIDLTHPINDGMLVYPGDPDVSFGTVHTIKETSYHVSRICMGSHSGTHIDAPGHCLLNNKYVDGLPLDSLIGWAEVLDIGEKEPNSDITAADLDIYADRVHEGARLILKTGWSRMWGQQRFYTDFPNLTQGAVTWLINRKVKLIAIEQPSVNRRNHVEVHKALLSANIMLVESIANLDKLSKDRVFIAALPLKLAGLDGSPVRIVAIEDMDIA